MRGVFPVCLRNSERNEMCDWEVADEKDKIIRDNSHESRKRERLVWIDQVGGEGGGRDEGHCSAPKPNPPQDQKEGQIISLKGEILIFVNSIYVFN